MLKPMDSLGASKDAYIPGSINPGVINGTWLGLPVKTDLKTIIWYSPANFQALGYTVPTTWDELNTLVEKMVSDGNFRGRWALNPVMPPAGPAPTSFRIFCLFSRVRTMSITSSTAQSL